MMLAHSDKSGRFEVKKGETYSNTIPLLSSMRWGEREVYKYRKQCERVNVTYRIKSKYPAPR
jgi:hypothetical protein